MWLLLSCLPSVKLSYIYTSPTPAASRSVIYTDSCSSLHLLLSRHPLTSTNLVHSIQQALINLTTQGWEVTLQWVPSHRNIKGNEIADAAAKMALTEVNITPLPLPLSTAKGFISQTCYSTWDNTLNNALRATSMGQYRTSSSPQLWIRQTFRCCSSPSPP